MTLKARQITLVASTPTPVLVQGVTGTDFYNISGTIQDPVPLIIKNEDASAVVWVGGSDVDATHGQSLGAGQSMPMALYGSSEIPYIYSTGTPIVSVLVGRQGP